MTILKMPAVLSLVLLTVVAAAQSAPQASTANVFPQQEGFVDANGVMIYYKILGHGEPLMIVHGGPGASHDYFLPYLLSLARHHELIFIDERGSGRSQKLEDAGSVAAIRCTNAAGEVLTVELHRPDLVPEITRHEQLGIRRERDLRAVAEGDVADLASRRS